MLSDWLDTALLWSIGEKVGGLITHSLVTQWHLGSLDNTCAPVLKCEAPVVTLQCPETKACEAVGDCLYYQLLIKLLWAVIVSLLILVVGLACGFAWACFRSRARATEGGKGARQQALAIKGKYAAP